MQAIILADREGSELGQLTDETGMSMLPIANKPLLQYAIEDCVASGITDIVVVTSKLPNLIKTHFESGQYWGINISYRHSRGEEHPDQILRRFRSSITLPFLLLRGDIYRTNSCQEFLSKANVHCKTELAVNGSENLGLMMIRDWATSVSAVAWPLNQSHHGPSAPEETVLPEVKVSQLNSFISFHRANLDCMLAPVSEKVASANTPQAQVEYGPLTEIHHTTHLTGPTMIGKHTEILKNVVVGASTIIGENCFIDENVTIKNSVVMPNTYIGKNLNIENAIITPSQLVRVDRNTVVEITDQVLLAHIPNSVEHFISLTVERALGVFLLAGSIPLWPIAAIATSLQSDTTIFKKVKIPVNPRHDEQMSGSECKTATAILFATEIPILRKLPLVVHVASGRLRLFGIHPLRDSDEFTQSTSANYNWGMLGPSQLFLSANATGIEVELAEREFSSLKGPGTFVKRVYAGIRRLLHRSSWTRSNTQPNERALSMELEKTL